MEIIVKYLDIWIFFCTFASKIVHDMKRVHKIWLIVISVVVAVFAGLFIGADVLVSRFVQKKVDAALANIPGCEAQCGDIHVFLFSGTAEVNGLRFVYHGKPVSKRDTIGPGVEVSVDKLVVGRVFYTMLLQKRVLVSDVRIIRPAVEVWLDDKHPDACFPKIEDKGLEKADKKLVDAEVQRFHLKNANVRLHSLRTQLDVRVDSCSLTAHNLRYDSVFSYNDSVYDFSLEHAAVMLPDGRMHIEANNIEQEDQGKLSIGRTRVNHTMNRRKLGELVKEPVTWMDLRVESVQTSPFNPIRKVLAKDYTLESLKVVVEKMDVFRDNRRHPTHTYPMPQEAILKAKEPFRIGVVNAEIKQIDIALATTDVNCGEMQLKKISASVQNITNKRGETMNINGSCPIGQGKAKAEIALTMNKSCDFACHMNVTNAEADFLNPFIRPLVGISFDMVVDEIETRYKGNNISAGGTFKLLYHGLKVQVHKEDDIPFKVVTKNANTITQLANTLVPKSNPSTVDIRPREYDVEWKRDEWKPFPLYLFGPCIDGVKKTMLPGLNVHKQTKSRKSKVESRKG